MSNETCISVIHTSFSLTVFHQHLFSLLDLPGSSGLTLFHLLKLSPENQYFSFVDQGTTTSGLKSQRFSCIDFYFFGCV